MKRRKGPKGSSILRGLTVGKALLAPWRIAFGVGVDSHDNGSHDNSSHDNEAAGSSDGQDRQISSDSTEHHSPSQGLQRGSIDPECQLPFVQRGSIPADPEQSGNVHGVSIDHRSSAQSEYAGNSPLRDFQRHEQCLYDTSSDSGSQFDPSSAPGSTQTSPVRHSEQSVHGHDLVSQQV